MVSVLTIRLLMWAAEFFLQTVWTHIRPYQTLIVSIKEIFENVSLEKNKEKKELMCYNVTNAPKDKIFLELRPKVKVKVTVMWHSATPRGIHTGNLGFIPQIIQEICSGHDYSKN